MACDDGRQSAASIKKSVEEGEMMFGDNQPAQEEEMNTGDTEPVRKMKRPVEGEEMICDDYAPVENGKGSAHSELRVREENQKLKKKLETLGEKNIQLQKRLSEYESAPSDNVPVQIVKELIEELNTYKARFALLNDKLFPDNNTQHEHLETRQNLANFLDDYNKLVKKIASREADIAKLEAVDSHRLKKMTNMAELNKNLSLQIEEIKKVLESYKGREHDAENNQVKPHELNRFVSPCNCPVSCGYQVLFFILHYMEIEVCNRRLVIESYHKANTGLRSCKLSLQDLDKIGIVDKETAFSAKITDVNEINSFLDKAVDKIKTQSRPAYLLIEWEGEQVGHCLAIMPYGEIIDVKERCYWKPKSDKRISEMHFVNVNKKALNDLGEKCRPQNCEV